MITVWIYSLVSVTFVSLVSLIGIITIYLKEDKLSKVLVYFVSFSAGALLGDVFLHLLPEVSKNNGLTVSISLYLLIGIIFSFIMEKIIFWRHCHMPITKTHVHRFVYMNLFGDSIHNFIDGMIIGASFIASVSTGFATTIAIILHEIPQEIGDFAVSIHGGIGKEKALFFNFITALTAFLGMIFALSLGFYLSNINEFLIPFSAGTLIYIAGSDLIPELHKEMEMKKNIVQIFTFVTGIAIMALLLNI